MALKILLLTFITLSMVSGEALDFYYTMLPRERVCFDELISETTHVIVGASTTLNDLAMQVYDPDQKILYNQERQQQLSYLFTSFTGGKYKICYQNLGTLYLQFSFSLKTGIDAKDYGSIVRESDLKPSELSARKIEDLSKDL